MVFYVYIFAVPLASN